MSDPFVGEIRIFAGNFAPTGWALCNGQILSISQNTALFSLLGTFYGGNGQSTFALPNLQDCTPMHQGQGPGLSQRFIGESGGAPSITLLTSEIPFHTHSLIGTTANANTQSPAGNALAVPESGDSLRDQANTMMAPAAAGIAGSSFPHNNMQPFLTLTFIIALQGIYPPRT